MKRLISILIIIVICFMIFSMSAAAEEADLYHLNAADKQLVETISKYDYSIRLFIKRYLEKHYLSEGESVDESKISYDLTKLHTTYKWKPEDVTGFLRTKDKETYLKTLEANYYSFPAYYDGKLLEDYTVSVKYYEDHEAYRVNSFDTPSSRHLWSNYFIRIDRTEKSLEELDITGHNILQTAQCFGTVFVLTEKNGNHYAIYAQQVNSWSSPELHTYLNEKETELVTKRVLNADEVEELHKAYLEYKASTATEPNNEDGGTNLSKNNWWIWFAAGGAVLLVGAVLTVVLISRQRKAR